MTQWLDIVADVIRPREIEQVRAVFKNGGVLIVPSDSGYALLCQLGDKSASRRIRQIRELDKDHPFTLLCSDLNRLARYVRVNNVQYRLLKVLFPGAFTCILESSRKVPRLVQNDKRKTIGIRVPDHPILHTLINACDEVLMGVSLFDSDGVRITPCDLEKALVGAVDLVVDAGSLPVRPTTILDLIEMPPLIIRQGAGDASRILG